MLDDPYFALLEALAQGLRGVDPARFVRDQSVEVRGRRVDLFLERDHHDRAEDRIVLRCDVSQLAAEAPEALCRPLLRANNLMAGTGGATLGLRGDNVVVLSASARVRSLDAARLAMLMTGLLRQAERWSAEIARPEFLVPVPTDFSSLQRA